ncbi:hypothetical protein ACFL5H_03770 [Candidatus Latescibacterota bacterium]
MEINGIPPGNNKLGNVDGKPKTGASNFGKPSEPVNNPDVVSGKDRLEGTALVVDTEFEPRLKLIDMVTRRLTGEEKNEQAGPDSVTGKAMAGTEQTDETDKNLSADYYGSKQIVSQIAEKIAPIIDISGMFGDGST